MLESLGAVLKFSLFHIDLCLCFTPHGEVAARFIQENFISGFISATLTTQVSETLLKHAHHAVYSKPSLQTRFY